MEAEINSAKGTSEFYRYRFLMGAMHHQALAQTVRQFCIPEDAGRLEDITSAWRGASAKMVEFSKSELKRYPNAGIFGDRGCVDFQAGNRRGQIAPLHFNRINVFWNDSVPAI